MVLSILFGKKYAQSNIGGVVLDATLSEDHTYNSRVTSYPIENGKIISDHIINDPETVQITGIVTDTPLSILSSFNRSISAFNRLIQIHNNRERVTVVTGIKVYTNMVMTSLQVPRNVQTGQSLTFVIELQKVLLDSTVKLALDPNDPFNKGTDKILREQVSEANKYPFYESDPNSSFKDQASSSVNVGIQDLIPIPSQIIPNIYDQAIKLRGIV
jgi:hypothetical protein